MAFLFYVKVAFLEESFFIIFDPKFFQLLRLITFSTRNTSRMTSSFDFVHGDLALGFERTG